MLKTLRNQAAAAQTVCTRFVSDEKAYNRYKAWPKKRAKDREILSRQQMGEVAQQQISRALQLADGKNTEQLKHKIETR